MAQLNKIRDKCKEKNGLKQEKRTQRKAYWAKKSGQALTYLTGDITLYYYGRCQLGHVMGAQWLSGRVLDSRPKGRGFEPHRRHCVVVLEQDTFILT